MFGCRRHRYPHAAVRLRQGTLAVWAIGLLSAAVLPAPTFANTFSAVPADLEYWRSLREQALAFEHGEGVAKDPLRALQLYCTAARGGDAESYYAIGWMIANGRGLARDDATAAYFLQQAAHLGHLQAGNLLQHLGPPTEEVPHCLRDEPELPVVAGEVPDDPLAGFDYRSDKQRELAELVVRLSPEYGIAPRLALAVAHTESHLDAQAVSSKNAQGLMQLIPETSQRFNVKKPFDPEQNVRGGLAYLRWLLAYFRGDVALAVAAYNAGEGAVNRYQGIPPYAETRAYVKRILQVFPQPEHPFDTGITDPSPELPKILKNKVRKRS